jgi:site-specific DNA recombinase
MRTLRSLIYRVVLTPDADAPDELRAELHGDLAEIVQLGEASQRRPQGQADGGLQNEGRPRTGIRRRQLSVVAGTRNHLDLLLTGQAAREP